MDLHTTTKAKTGRLESAGIQRNGMHTAIMYSKCVDCGTLYPHAKQGPCVIHPLVDGITETQSAVCNGVEISLCPWCRPDSQPWKNDRGI